MAYIILWVQGNHITIYWHVHLVKNVQLTRINSFLDIMVKSGKITLELAQGH